MTLRIPNLPPECECTRTVTLTSTGSITIKRAKMEDDCEDAKRRRIADGREVALIEDEGEQENGGGSRPLSDQRDDEKSAELGEDAGPAPNAETQMSVPDFDKDTQTLRDTVAETPERFPGAIDVNDTPKALER